MKTIGFGKALNGNLLLDNQEPPFVFILTDEDASTDYTTTVSGKDPNIILLDKHPSTCKTESGSENASNETLLDIMDNQELTDFITLTP